MVLVMVVGQGCRCKAQFKRLEFGLYKLTIPYSMGFFEKWLHVCIICGGTSIREGKYKQ